MEFEKEILNIYKEYSKVYGPYTRSDGRKHIILIGINGLRKTLSYPKALVEIREGRKLKDHETVDHHDRDKYNDESSNLKILPKSQHSKLDVERRLISNVICPWCGKSFTPTRGQLRKNVAGPFCTRSCSGKYGKSIQIGLVSKFDKTEINVSYFKLNK